MRAGSNEGVLEMGRRTEDGFLILLESGRQGRNRGRCGRFSLGIVGFERTRRDWRSSHGLR